MPTTARRRRELAGRVVAVTGAARGIGLHTAEAFAAAGALVVLGDLDETAVRAAAESVGHGAVGVRLDVTDTASFRAFLDAAEALGPLEVLVNNAGVMWVGPFDAEPASVVERHFAVNVGGVMRGTRLAAERMRGRGGVVVTLASAASKVAPRGEATYAATKHAVHGWLSAVRAELRGSGVEICMVLPGVVETELAAGTRTGPVRRLRPEQVADAVVRVAARPRFETVLPGRIALLHKLFVLLPAPARDLMGRLALPDQLAAVRDGGDRRDYERRTFPS